jgi:branched-subunit amino acid aminotransferase/4-amino-4-deoxychorismate lyase
MVLELAERDGCRVVRRPVSLAELLVAQEIWLTSTPSSLLPVVSVNGALVGEGRPGPVYRRLLARWSAAVGVDIAEQARSWR